MATRYNRTLSKLTAIGIYCSLMEGMCCTYLIAHSSRGKTICIICYFLKLTSFSNLPQASASRRCPPTAILFTTLAYDQPAKGNHSVRLHNPINLFISWRIFLKRIWASKCLRCNDLLLSGTFPTSAPRGFVGIFVRMRKILIYGRIVS